MGRIKTKYGHQNNTQITYVFLLKGFLSNIGINIGRVSLMVISYMAVHLKILVGT